MACNCSRYELPLENFLFKPSWKIVSEWVSEWMRERERRRGEVEGENNKTWNIGIRKIGYSSFAFILLYEQNSLTLKEM